MKSINYLGFDIFLVSLDGLDLLSINKPCPRGL